MHRPLQHPSLGHHGTSSSIVAYPSTDDLELFAVEVAKSVFVQFCHSSILFSLAFFCKESFSLSNLLIMYSWNSFEYSRILPLCAGCFLQSIADINITIYN